MRRLSLPTKIVSLTLLSFILIGLMFALPFLGIPLTIFLVGYHLGRYIYYRFIRMEKEAFKAMSQGAPPALIQWIAVIGTFVIIGILLAQFFAPTLFEIFAPAEVTFVDKMTIRQQVAVTGADKNVMNVEILDADLKTIGSDILTTPNYVAVFEELDVPQGYVWLRIWASGVYWIPELTPELEDHPNTTGLIADTIGDVSYYRLDLPSSTFTLDVYIAEKLSIDIYKAEDKTGLANSTYSLFTTTVQLNLTNALSWAKSLNFTITANATYWNATNINVLGKSIDIDILDDDGDGDWETDESLTAFYGDYENTETDDNQTIFGLITWEGEATGGLQYTTLSLEYIDEDGDVVTMDEISFNLSNFV
jgi:hypothetical protein